METIVIKTQNLSCRFGNVLAVDHLNLQVAQREIFGLLGPDGAGKTTTLRLLCGLLGNSEGKAWVAGYDVARDAGPLRDQIGYMAQRFGLYGDLTVEENMAFYADLYGISKRERAKLMGDLFKMTRMEAFVKRQARALSGGMKQKLALMCALLHRPKILFLDEPTNGVDPLSRRDFWVILNHLAEEGLTIFLSTAYMDEAERCHRVGLMHQGRLIRCDSPHAIKESIEEPCYVMHCADQRAVRDILLTLEGVVSVQPFGSVCHLFLSSKASSLDVYERVVTEKGLGPVTFTRVKPSLEDVFIALMRKATSDQGIN
ncbi:MAG: ATP-binding cassette domain-containing protein [bacterium]